MYLSDVNRVQIRLASPERIRSWSWGEVKKPETINYRTLKPEKDGLFCEKIFGPTKDWECYCGKYKKSRYKGIICDRCGVEVTHSKVRRERMGRIELASPVCHIWYVKGVPGRISALLNIKSKDLEKVVYYINFIITQVEKERILDLLPLMKDAVALEIEEYKDIDYSADAVTKLNIPEIVSELMDEFTASKGYIPKGGKKALYKKGDKLSAKMIEALLKEGRFEVEVDGPDGKGETSSLLDMAADYIVGQPLTEAVVDPASGEVLAQAKQALTREGLQAALEAGIMEFHYLDEGMLSFLKTKEKEEHKRLEEIEAALELLPELEVKQLLSEAEHRRLQLLGEVIEKRLGLEIESFFRAMMGAEAVKTLLGQVSMEEEATRLRIALEQTNSKAKRLKYTKRLSIIRAFLRSGNKPEWMILEVLPVIPPELRPMVQLEGGRFAASDLNDLYRRVINRNSRLKRLIDIKAPESLIRNEKRMLQEAVDALIDNGRRGKLVTGTNNRALKSLSDLLKGKQGRFRQNLLGKRVDYSGRSVIVVGPELQLHQCGLPKIMALEFFKPFVLKKIVDRGYAPQIKNAKMLVEQLDRRVWEVLEEVIQGNPVMLNRAPTLHRLGIQAFEPVLIEGKAIQIHPLVCTAFNADFDGDQMAVHLPLSLQAQAEARLLMLSSNNLLKPADGKPIVGPTQDMIMGIYWLTLVQKDTPVRLLKDLAEKPKKGQEVRRKIFATEEEAVLYYELGRINIHEPILVRVKRDMVVEPGGGGPVSRPQLIPGKVLETTVGRVIFNSLLPEKLPFYNQTMSKKVMGIIVAEIHRFFGNAVTVECLDRLKNEAFAAATRAGMTVSIFDVLIPDSKEEILKETHARVAEIRKNEDADLTEIAKKHRRFTRAQVEQIYENLDHRRARRRDVRDSLARGKNEEERSLRLELFDLKCASYDAVIEAYSRATSEVTQAMTENYEKNFPTNPTWMMATSGARGNIQQVRQLGALRGLMADPTGHVIPVITDRNLREGLTVLQYFVTTHGARKGLADTALRTADSGYLTRRLVDVAQDVTVQEYDCGTTESLELSEQRLGRRLMQSLGDRILGRVAAQDIIDTETGEAVVLRNQEIIEEDVEKIAGLGIKSMRVRSPLTCEARRGICQLCYGRDLGTGKLAEPGVPAGIIAAQSIGEPGTQLTMRTFHIGGVAGGADITKGLPDVELLFELFQAGYEKRGAVMAPWNGTISIERDENTGQIVLMSVISKEDAARRQKAKEDADAAAANAKPTARKSTKAPVVRVTAAERALAKESTWMGVDLEGSKILVEHGDEVKKGQELTEGKMNPRDVLRLRGVRECQKFLVDEVQSIYKEQGVDTNDKHIEVIVRQMMKYVRITETGDSDLLKGDLIEHYKFREIVEVLAERGMRVPEAEPVLLGISKASLSTDSFLSTASFQETTKVLTNAAVEGKTDYLRGLKENVIIGRLVPVGTGRHDLRRLRILAPPVPGPSHGIGQGFETPEDYDDEPELGEAYPYEMPELPLPTAE
ncbi:MAG: DNA-directed RNA polymerase subunit beta' [bacterium]|nr:DNA-directed RNA polymerase subunit beta' [bacterium]